MTWLQLLLVVAICVDRAGHIFKPLRYSYSVTAFKTVVVIVLCTAFPFLTLTLPHIIAAHSTINYWKVLDETVSSDMAYKCDWARVFNEHGHELSSNWRIFMCKLDSGPHDFHKTTLLYILHVVLCTLYCVHCTLCTLYTCTHTVYIQHCTLAHCALYCVFTLHCSEHIVHCKCIV